ncbi:sugar-binding transcriptional regulator [Colwellia sp. 4_MG-2023]|uniref:sugar-binding transcriptional regulator n=1 Tax=unclassified Colwellia TaxID=196834 RepID=UPI001C08D53B|nr:MULTISPECIES: sugar-binding transcriptional regulator [unclassified Colwellia]MBU2926127.1 sugar-binding transcriptional regulator [Colwellia sp. C2M11]MDO6508326.1 sugar-binding transcriptional regulator [Colwellia sp. 5_MG-2023]MDO6556932.1 sugar-binding transcriptional regulator [Colwellia sp. 4_MG-2023]MDO6652452.1 sugar-binding transcriptional regulator [Colwellia sp. 3_MG-2023]MDO6665673.1 sugar-binding transcriptional regulator [Colwellia sp. 2_MG-2023]
MLKRSKSEIRKLDDAAKAGWLYYVAGNTQEEIAKKLNISRQSAQRMVALSVSEGLIKVRLEHPIAKCMDLQLQLKSRFGLTSCIVVPSDNSAPNSTLGLAQAGAKEIEFHLKSPEPKVIAMGTGRVLRACVEELTLLNCEQHQIVALLGNMALDGSASSYDVVMRMAEHINAKHYPMPLPVLPSSKEEKEQLHAQRYIANNLKLASQADVTFIGVGNLAINSPLHIDGFVSPEELEELQTKGAVGELISWVLDVDGNLIDCTVNQRVASTPLKVNPEKPVYAIAAGEEKVLAILGALRSKLINGLITNEYTAERLLSIA